MLEQLVSAANKRTSTRVGEQLALKGVGRDNGNRGRAREVVKQLLEFAQFELSSVLDPWLTHELVVFLHAHEEAKLTPYYEFAVAYLVQVNDIKLLACHAVEQPALLVQEHDLQRFELLRKFSRGNIRVHVEDLACIRLR